MKHGQNYADTWPDPLGFNMELVVGFLVKKRLIFWEHFFPRFESSAGELLYQPQYQ